MLNMEDFNHSCPYEVRDTFLLEEVKQNIGNLYSKTIKYSINHSIQQSLLITNN